MYTGSLDFSQGIFWNTDILAALALVRAFFRVLIYLDELLNCGFRRLKHCVLGIPIAPKRGTNHRNQKAIPCLYILNEGFNKQPVTAEAMVEFGMEMEI